MSLLLPLPPLLLPLQLLPGVSEREELVAPLAQTPLLLLLTAPAISVPLPALALLSPELRSRTAGLSDGEGLLVAALLLPPCPLLPLPLP